MDVVYWGVPAVVVIGIVVQLARSAGLPTRFAALFACASGAILGGLVHAFGGDPAGAQTIAEAVFSGFIAGASAAGLYAAVKDTAGK